MNNKLFIIGNGFDLHHNLPTKFSDFQKYIRNKNSSLHYHLSSYFSQDLWSDFEKGLADFELDFALKDNAELLPNDSERSGDMYIFQDVMAVILNSLTTELKNSLRDWIMQIQIPSNISQFLITEINLDSDYLTFNYSDLLEKIYKIPINQITYIHNKAIKQNLRPDEADFIPDNSDIIIGHNLKNKKHSVTKIKNINGLNKIALQNGIEELTSYFELTFKNTKEIISEKNMFFRNCHHYSEITVIGHSLSSIDIPYFELLSHKSANAKWKISYLNDLTTIRKQAKLFIPNSKNVSFFRL